MLSIRSATFALLALLTACGGATEDETGQTSAGGSSGSSGQSGAGGSSGSSGQSGAGGSSGSSGQSGAGGTAGAGGASAGASGSGAGASAGSGGAGVGGAAGATGAGASGSSGHGGGSGSGGAVDWGTCAGPGTCELVGQGCCGACDPTAADLDAVNYEYVDEHAKQECPQPVSCGPCPPIEKPQGQNLAAFCVQAQCQVIDVRTDDVSSCEQDSDCVVRSAGCCSPCGGLGSAPVIALSKEGSAVYQEQVCTPLQSCPVCEPSPPGAAQAFCNAQKHCEIKAAPACPAEQPEANTPCDLPEVAACEYGDSIQITCRPRATCENGLWSVLVVKCPALPQAGESGCPSSFAVNGQKCGSEGLLCDMQSTGPGRTCACTSCAFGPCSTEPLWSCVDAPSNAPCPPVAPNTGAACASEGLSCSYGLCGSTSALRQCQGGVWADSPVACPL